MAASAQDKHWFLLQHPRFRRNPHPRRASPVPSPAGAVFCVRFLGGGGSVALVAVYFLFSEIIIFVQLVALPFLSFSFG